MKGIFYGVGVGPGGADMMTVQALKVIEGSDVIAVPAQEAGRSTAWKILLKAYPKAESLPVLPLGFPMTRDAGELARCHQSAAKKVEEQLERGRQVAFICLGDPCIYSTYSYTADIVRADGYTCRTISGIPSFCAAAAQAGIDLVQGQEPLHIFGSTDDAAAALALPGTKVFMKSGRAAHELLTLLAGSPEAGQVWLVENCGMEEEKIYTRQTGFPENPGYFSLIIVR
ncbi:MAG: precorrin-2 C(20)-methyltransferase [Lachnospiraceae bacterium]|jgi:precorrin-2/cobalt-factor-2 C20-methyltransferase